MTGDQSWFRMAYYHSGAWLLPEDGNQRMNGSKIQNEKNLVTIIWCVYCFYVVGLLPQGVSYDSDYFIENIFW